MNDRGYIFQGPSLDFDLPDCSLSEFVFPRLKGQDQTKVVQVNGETDESQTVGEFLSAGVRFAEGLESRGIKEDGMVVIIGKYSSNLFTAILGCALHSATQFPIDPTLKELELQRLFSISNPSIVFLDIDVLHNALGALENIGNKCEIFVLNSKQEFSSNRVHPFKDFLTNVDVDSFQPRSVKCPKTQVACILASSGTTGMPKAVEITHSNMINGILTWRPEQLGLGLSFLQVTHAFWLTGFCITFFSCNYGVKRIFVPTATPDNVIAAVDKYKAQSSFLAPIHLNGIVNHPNFRDYDVSSLTYIQTGGSILPQITIDLMKAKWPTKDFKLCQCYGSTETTGCITQGHHSAPISSLGPLAMGMSAQVIDRNSGKALGPDEEGELVLKSTHGMMKGYMKNPEASAEAIDEYGFYHTGDLGYITKDNLVYITNRIKDLIKCKGHQVSPMEIEETILAMNGVKDAAVVGVPHEVDLYHPRAAVVRQPGSTITEQDVVKFVENKLSSTKHLYGGAEFVGEIPRNNNGKIVRNKVKIMLGIE